MMMILGMFVFEVKSLPASGRLTRQDADQSGCNPSQKTDPSRFQQGIFTDSFHSFQKPLAMSLQTVPIQQKPKKEKNQKLKHGLMQIVDLQQRHS